jgi:prepilin-type N-terminal cleavage/methylation domain-containing protein
MSRTKQPEPGFSLPELIVIMAITGILAGLAIPNFTRNWQDERLNSANKQTIAWLDDLRRKAIQQSSPCSMEISNSPALLTGSCQNLPDQISTLNLSAEIANMDQLTFTLASNSPSTWIFTPRGTTTTDAELRMTLAGSDLGRCIRLLEPLGLLRSGKLRSSTCVYTTSY